MTGAGCSLCGDPPCLGDVDLSLVAGGVASGATPVKALRQAAAIAESVGANDVFHQLVEWRVSREETA